MTFLTAFGQILATVLVIGGIVLGLESVIARLINAPLARRAERLQARRVRRAMDKQRPFLDECHARMMAADHAAGCYLRDTDLVKHEVVYCMGCADGTQRTMTLVFAPYSPKPAFAPLARI